MCNPTWSNKPRQLRRKHSLLLLSTSSFDSYSEDKYVKGSPQPTKLSTFITVAVIVAMLFTSEYFCLFIFTSCKHFHPLLEIEMNRRILARHIGVDFTSCSTVAYLGLKNFHVCKDLVSNALRRSNSMSIVNFRNRLFSYVPAAQQISLIFFAYQVKNMYDSIVWNDGLEFILHHLFAGFAAWGGMYPGCGHFYIIFFMGISEISTAILCLLANFDDTYGVRGMAEAFPITRVIVAMLFVLAFVCCRTLIWPYVSFHFVRDALAALKSDCPQSHYRRNWIKSFMFVLSGLSLLQIVWLGQIILMAKEEIAKML